MTVLSPWHQSLYSPGRGCYWNGRGFGNIHNTVPIRTKRSRWLRHVTPVLTIVIPVYSSKRSDYCCDSIVFIRAVSEINLNNCGLTLHVLIRQKCIYQLHICEYIPILQWTRPPLIQIMPCRPNGTQPLSDPKRCVTKWNLGSNFKSNLNENMAIF